MKKFEINKKYYMTSICNSECVWTYEVTARTEKTITLKELDSIGRTIKCRISKSSTDHEIVYPEGRYSMAPVLRATREI